MEPEPDKISRNLLIYVLTYAPQTKTVDTTISKHKTNRSRSSLLCNVEPSLTFNSFSEIQFDCGTNQLAESLNPRTLLKKAVVKIVQPEIQNLNGLYLLSTKTWTLLMFVTMMITGPSSNQGHRSFYQTLHRNEVRGSRLNFPMLCLKFCIHYFFKFNYES